MPLVLLQVCGESCVKIPQNHVSLQWWSTQAWGQKAKFAAFQPISRSWSPPNTPRLWESTKGSHGTIVMTLIDQCTGFMLLFVVSTAPPAVITKGRSRPQTNLSRIAETSAEQQASHPLEHEHEEDTNLLKVPRGVDRLLLGRRHAGAAIAPANVAQRELPRLHVLRCQGQARAAEARAAVASQGSQGLQVCRLRV